MRRMLLVLLLVVVPCLAIASPISTPKAGADTATDEAQFWQLLNQERANHGVPAIPRDGRLDAIARNWSAHMAAQGAISHNPNLRTQLPPGWTKGGENVGCCSSVAGIHQAFVNSPEHEANLIDPSWSAVGIGVAYSSGGTIYVTEDFASYPPPPAAAPPAPRPPVRAPPPAPVAKPAPHVVCQTVG